MLGLWSARAWYCLSYILWHVYLIELSVVLVTLLRKISTDLNLNVYLIELLVVQATFLLNIDTYLNINISSYNL